jgi:uncharacterized protein (TIGR03435 family)
VTGEIFAAYGLDNPSQILNAPVWASYDAYSFDIAAESPTPRAEMDTRLLRNVLARCFALKVREDSKPVPGFALTISPRGIKFPVAKPGSKEQAYRVVDGIQHFSRISQLVEFLNQFYYQGKLHGVSRPVHDATGLTGSFDIPIAWPEPAENILAALATLGLEVKSAPGVEKTLGITNIDHLRTSCVLP